MEILNKKGDSMSRLPVAGTTKKLLIELKVIWHCEWHLLHYCLLSVHDNCIMFFVCMCRGGRYYLNLISRDDNFYITITIYIKI